MTAWFRENEIGSDGDTAETAKHEHFTKTISLAFNTLFPGDVAAVSTPPDQISDPELATPLFSNSFGPLESLPTDKPSTLADAKILNEWADSNMDNRSTIVDDPFDEIFELYRYAQIKMEKFGAGKIEQHGGVKLVWDAIEKCHGSTAVNDLVWKSV